MKLNFIFNSKIKFVPILYHFLGNFYYFVILFDSNFSFYIKNYSIKIFLYILKCSNLFQIKLLNDIVVIDLFAEKNRFKFVYNLKSIKYSLIFLINFFSSDRVLVDSISFLFKSSN